MNFQQSTATAPGGSPAMQRQPVSITSAIQSIDAQLNMLGPGPYDATKLAQYEKLSQFKTKLLASQAQQQQTQQPIQQNQQQLIGLQRPLLSNVVSTSESQSPGPPPLIPVVTQSQPPPPLIPVMPSSQPSARPYMPAAAGYNIGLQPESGAETSAYHSTVTTQPFSSLATATPRPTIVSLATASPRPAVVPMTSMSVRPNLLTTSDAVRPAISAVKTGAVMQQPLGKQGLQSMISMPSVNALPPMDNSQVLNKRRIQDLVKEIDPNEQLDEDVEEMLMQIADDFIEDVFSSACLLAKHRKATTVDVSDVQTHLERRWNMWIPGFGGDDSRPPRKAPMTEAHKQRLALIKKTMKKY